MKNHHIRVYKEEERLPKEEQLAWKFAELASDHVPLDKDVSDMIINRFIDNASVAVASLNRSSAVCARAQALTHPKENGATVFGLSSKYRMSPEWAVWANGTAVRELDWHDTFLAADYSHPADNIPPLLAVAQTLGVSGADLMRGVAVAYEIHVALVKAICLHKHKIDHVAHLGPAAAAGIGAMLKLDKDTIYQAVQQALHVTCATRQSRKGEISSWKAFAPAHAGKLAIEAVDRAMRGEGAPSPIYEGEDSVIAWMLDGPEASYTIPLPEKGEPKRQIMDTYTKEHSAEYQSQALIDLAFDLRKQIKDFSQIERIMIHTSHHTHYVIGTGANDPQKMDPKASRETLDHSIMYIFAVALEDGSWHHVDSYTPERAGRPDTVSLWHKVETCEDPEWTKRYHASDPNVKAFGGRVEIFMKDGSVVTGEKAVANAHTLGATPWVREHYIGKFTTVTEGILSDSERARFLELVQRLPELSASDLLELNPKVDEKDLDDTRETKKGIF